MKHPHHRMTSIKLTSFGRRVLQIIPQVAAIGAATVFFTGCAWFTPPMEKPVIEDKIGSRANGDRIGTLATTADRRSVITKFRSNETFFVAEPPPDAIQNIVAKLDLLAKGSGSSTKDELKIEAELKALRELTTQAVRLSTRSQGILYLRDASYRLAEARANGFMKCDDFATNFHSILTNAQKLIEVELKRNTNTLTLDPCCETKSDDKLDTAPPDETAPSVSQIAPGKLFVGETNLLTLIGKKLGDSRIADIELDGFRLTDPGDSPAAKATIRPMRVALVGKPAGLLELELKLTLNDGTVIAPTNKFPFELIERPKPAAAVPKPETTAAAKAAPKLKLEGKIELEEK